MDSGKRRTKSRIVIVLSPPTPLDPEIRNELAEPGREIAVCVHADISDGEIQLVLARYEGLVVTFELADTTAPLKSGACFRSSGQRPAGLNFQDRHAVAFRPEARPPERG